MQEKKKQIALCLTLSIYFSPAFARLADSRIVAKKKKKQAKRKYEVRDLGKASCVFRITFYCTNARYYL